MSLLVQLRGLKYPDAHVTRFFFKLKLHQQPGKVVEFGCGNGNNLLMFYQYGWEVTGVDADAAAIADAQANFALAQTPQGAYRFLQHDLSKGLPRGLTGPFDVLLLPNLLCYLPRAATVQLLRQMRPLARPGASFFLSTRSILDYRYRRGEQVEPNGFRLTIAETGEQGALNVFYHEHELVDMLREHLGADPDRLTVLRADYQNPQQGVLISNADIILWGPLRG